MSINFMEYYGNLPHKHTHTNTHNVVTNPIKKPKYKFQFINVSRIITALTHFKAHIFLPPKNKKHRIKMK